MFLLSPAAAFITGATLRVDGAAPNAKRHHEFIPHDRAPAFQGFHRAVPPKALEEE